jgi:hypothetical protein
MVYPINGYLLTVEQILELTSWGIRDLTKRVEEEQVPKTPTLP